MAGDVNFEKKRTQPGVIVHERHMSAQIENNNVTANNCLKTGSERKKNKEKEIKKITDELEKTIQQGLLDSTAMIRVTYNSDTIFETDPLKALMVVVENRNYIRKDLPKHVPQSFVV